MSKRYNITLIKRNHCYTFQEIAKLFHLDISTPRRWYKQGLKVLDEHQRPYLVLGKDLISFLKKQKAKRKTILSEGEFMCTHCRKARRSKNDEILIVMSDAEFSAGNRKADIVGVCETCGLEFRLFSSERKIKEMLKKGQILLPQGVRLIWSATKPINARFRRIDL